MQYSLLYLPYHLIYIYGMVWSAYHAWHRLTLSDHHEGRSDTFLHHLSRPNQSWTSVNGWFLGMVAMGITEWYNFARAKYHHIYCKRFDSYLHGYLCPRIQSYTSTPWHRCDTLASNTMRVGSALKPIILNIVVLPCFRFRLHAYPMHSRGKYLWHGSAYGE